ncbi:MAG: hypothetical protein AB1Z65_01045 [Candidatus Sulfomarinibacteraceae bacterium]
MTRRPDPFPGVLAPPQAPPGLRQRVIAAARAAAEGDDEPDRWARIWESRPVRLAWAASIGALIFGHLVIGGPVGRRSAQPAIPLAAAVETDHELAEIVGLERMTVDLPGWEIHIARDPVQSEPLTADEEPS